MSSLWLQVSNLGFCNIWQNICSTRSLQLKNGYSEELELSSILLQIISKQVKLKIKYFFSQDWWTTSYPQVDTASSLAVMLSRAEVRFASLFKWFGWIRLFVFFERLMEPAFHAFFCRWTLLALNPPCDPHKARDTPAESIETRTAQTKCSTDLLECLIPISPTLSCLSKIPMEGICDETCQT